jgi:Peptidase family M23
LPQGRLHVYGLGSVGVVVACAASVLLLAPPAGEAEHPKTGGTEYVPQPTVRSIKCTAKCASHGRVRNGGTVRLRGSELAMTRRVVFMGDHGRRDDVAVPVDPTSDRVLSVKVPYGADSGPLSAWAGKRAQSKPSRPLAILPSPPPLQTGKLSRATGPAEHGAPELQTAVSSGLVFARGRGVSFSYRVDDGGPADVVIRLVAANDGNPVRTWRQDAVVPGDVQTVTWDGGDHGETAADGRYAFKLIATGPTGATAKNASDRDDERDAFDLHGFAFPLHAHHTYGDGYGAARSGHTHEGQDIFADCGAPIYAARGGTVKDKKFQSAAGNYVVIDGAGTGYDNFYAHLRKPSPLEAGDKVFTGQKIGSVGDTGDAVGCHLHFEIWSAPGWYSGGHPIDPARFLKAWDRYS